MDEMLQSICQMSEITVLAPFDHGVLDGVILFIENSIKEKDYSFVKHEIWTLMWRRVEQLIHIQSQNGTEKSDQNINKLSEFVLHKLKFRPFFLYLESIEHWSYQRVILVFRKTNTRKSNKLPRILAKWQHSVERGKKRSWIQTRLENQIISKTFLEHTTHTYFPILFLHCPNVIRALTAVFIQFKNNNQNLNKFSRAIVNSGIFSKLKLPQNISRENQHIAFSIIHLWRLTLEHSANENKIDILEVLFKSIPTNLESKTQEVCNRDELTSENLLYIMTQLARSGKKRYLALAVKILIGKN